MKKFRLHPAFVAMCLCIIVFSEYKLLFISIGLAVLHELSHAAAAKIFGYRLDTVVLMPYGAVISGEENLESSDAFFIAAAGPAINIALAFITVALWWFFPALYNLSGDFVKANITLALFNLLPFYPLDGGRIILSFAKNKVKTLGILKGAGITGSLILMALFVVSAFLKINFTLGAAAICLFIGACGNAEKQKYIEICARLSAFADYDRPVMRQEMVVSGEITLRKLIMSLSSNKLYTLQIVDSALNTVCIIEEGDFDKLIAYPNKKEKIKNIPIVKSLA